MEKLSAKKLIQETLQNPFDKEHFIYLVKNILNYVDETPFTYGNFISNDFTNAISHIEPVGKYQSPDGKLIDILIVHLVKDISLDKSRTNQRNFVAKHLKNSGDGILKDAALVAFVTPNSDDWRFSFIKMEYKFNDKGKVDEEFTPAKRYSFLVGKNENSHTAQSRLLHLFFNEEANPTLTELEEAFSVEPVTNDFFEKYRELFLRLKESIDNIIDKDSKVRADFEAKNIDTSNFAKKLLGQIIFLYFLQKKGWFGVTKGKDWGTGDKNFLRSLFEKKIIDYKNFFNDILEPLFYEALRLERTDDSYTHFNCRIPFLNGGLFDPIGDYDWWNVDVLLPNEIFSNNIATKEGDIGDGILDVFDRYNFTVKEDEPLEKEVAIDPEMLGKVFENLLEVKDRKSKGTYYTPREIVHYMCQESLINYLVTELDGKVNKDDIETLIKYGETKYSFSISLPENIYKHAALIDEKLATIRVCDPAMGSGAFLVGMMSEIIRTRNALTPYIEENEEHTPYHFKRHTIQSSLYGSDIDSGAIDIAKLRLWLSLIVDEEDREKIQPLPNLDYKIMQGNSLLGIKKHLFNQYLFDELERLKPLYFNETSASKKKEYRKQIDKLISEITNAHKEFDFEVYFSEVFHEKGGFDVVIGNPPYIQLQKDSGKLANMYEKQKYETFARTGDIYALFYEKGMQLLKENGFLCYITSNKWMRAGYGEKTRTFFIKYNPLVLIDLGPSIFENATVDTNILLIQKANSEQKLLAVTLQKENNNINIAKQLNERGVILNKITKDAWFIGNSAEQSLKEKIERIGKPLKDWDVKIYRGLITGLNKAFIIDSKKREEILNNCKDEDEQIRTKAIIKPILRGRDIKRYTYEWAGLWVIFIPWHFPLHDDTSIEGVSNEAELEFKKQYPLIYNHLSQFKELLLKRNKEETGIRYEWYALQRCAATYYTEFEKEKVVWASVGETFYCWVDKKFFVLDTNYFTTSLQKWHLGVLNSNLIISYINGLDSLVGERAYRHYKYNFEKIAIPLITETNQSIVSQIEESVDKILATKKQNPQANTQEWENQIDQLVYKLYNLTDEEIRIVEK